MAIRPTAIQQYLPLATSETLLPTAVPVSVAPTSPAAPEIDYDTLVDLILKNIKIPEVDLSTIESRLGAIESLPTPAAPTIDYDVITDKVREGIAAPTFDTSGLLSAIEANRSAISSLPTVDLSGLESKIAELQSREMPTVDLSGLESRLKNIESREMPTVDLSGLESRISELQSREMPTVDLSGLESRISELQSREMPTFDPSGLLSAIEANRSAISSLPTVDLSGLESRLKNIESREMPTVDLSGLESRISELQSREMPTFDPSGLLSAIEANRSAISSLPTVDLSGLESRISELQSREMPTVDLSGIESRLKNIESREMPTFDPSGLLSAIEANRSAISSLPTFDTSGLLAAIEANRKAIEGLSLAPPIMGTQQPQVLPAQQVPAPAPVPAPVYDPVADMFVAERNKYVLDENGNVVQVPQDTGFIPDTPGGMVSTLDPNQRQQAVNAGLSPENIAALAGDMRVSPSYTPPTAPTPLSAFRNPSENAGLDWMSLDDQLGYFFSTNAANPADVKGNPSAFVPLDENAGYRLYDARTGEYVAEGVGAQGLQDVYSTAQNLSATGGTNADWRVEMRKPGSESWSTMARDKPKGDVLGTVADIALPAIGAAIAGPLGAAAGSGLSSVAQGRSLENTLLRSAISAGATAAGGSLLGEAAGGAGTAAGQAAGEVAGQAAGEAALNVVGPSIIVEAAKQAAPSVAGTVLGGAAGGALANVVTPPSPPQGNVIEVVGRTPTPETLPVSEGLLAAGALATPAIATTLPTAPTTTAPELPPTENQIVVEAPRLQPMPGAEELIGAATVGSVAAGALPTGGILQSGQTPTDGTTTMETGGSLLDDIIKYYSLGSIGLDALGGALGLGGGGGQAAAPYVSQLGPMPTFTRGGFTPYTGDYETYGFGPEFNFFGGPAPITPTAPPLAAAPITPTAPAMGVLGPNTPTYTPLI